jgi:nitrogen fixation/metabolism regulation signal transduction histidine kinase
MSTETSTRAPDTRGSRGTTRRRILGTTARRVAAAIFITALLPLVAGTLTARALLARASAIAFQPEFGAHLDRALGVYADLAKAIKAEMRAEADAIAASHRLLRDASGADPARVEGDVARAFAEHPSLVELELSTCGGRRLGRTARDQAVDPTTERTLTVRRTLRAAREADDSDGPRDEREPPEEGHCLPDQPDQPFLLTATFAAPRGRLDELETMQAFTQAYHQIELHHREEYLDQPYANVFAALLFATLVLASLAGALVVRPATRRIEALAAAMRPVAEGDLSVRVALDGDDEVAELGRAFDRMLEELGQSRARVEFMKRMSEWQKMARRIAHEIKNPLTPIQLAVEECHRRYRGDDEDYRRILQTTFEVVNEEVASLRRLVTEFSSFARLPRAKLEVDDLGAFLREQAARLEAPESDADQRSALGVALVSFNVPATPMPAMLDREMLHRVLGNVIQNAVQAIRDAKRGGRVVLTARVEGDRYVLDVDDDGPGIAEDVGQLVFDPYVTTKRDGTGLGLSIVKKIVVDHGGSIDAGRSPLGGARFHVVLPRAGSPAAEAALERAEPSPESIRFAGPASRS